jgi:hypothetical protein
LHCGRGNTTKPANKTTGIDRKSVPEPYLLRSMSRSGNSMPSISARSHSAAAA